MPHEAAFMAEILAHPEADGPRLLFADWLDENGTPERSEFVRVQVALARTPQFLPMDECEVCGNTINEEGVLEHGRGCYTQSSDGGGSEFAETNPQYEALRRRERELLSANEGRWLDWLKAAWGAEWVPVRECSVVWRRGFAEIVTLTAADWLAHADALTAAAPIREVRLTTWLDMAELPDLGWCFVVYGRGQPMPTPFARPIKAKLRRAGLGELGPGLLDALRAEWPRIAFTLPPVALPSPDEVDLGGVVSFDARRR